MLSSRDLNSLIADQWRKLEPEVKGLYQKEY